MNHSNQTIKPSWFTAPRWANFLAQDNNGDWFWYEYMPTIRHNNKYWTEDIVCGAVEMAYRETNPGHFPAFDVSLEARPKGSRRRKQRVDKGKQRNRQTA